MDALAPVPIHRALRLVGDLLAAERAEVRVVVVGGAALHLRGLVDRTTEDVDVIALGERHGGEVRLVPPTPLPDVLARAIATVARDLAIPATWMNTAVVGQWDTGLPPDLDSEIEWRGYGGLAVGLAGRASLIALKLYASADQRGPESRHVQDLVALQPSDVELGRAARWIATQDPTIGPLVVKVIAHVRANVR